MWRLPEEENLEIAYLSHLFDKMSESYKIFWFQAIVNGVARGQAVFTYEELLDEMVADAWYMVSEYRLNLEEILLPVYQSAHNMGFGEWEYRD